MATLLVVDDDGGVVLLDFCLPKMDGELPRTTPVIVMSAASLNWVASSLARTRSCT